MNYREQQKVCQSHLVRLCNPNFRIAISWLVLWTFILQYLGKKTTYLYQIWRWRSTHVSFSFKIVKKSWLSFSFKLYQVIQTICSICKGYLFNDFLWTIWTAIKFCQHNLKFPFSVSPKGAKKMRIQDANKVLHAGFNGTITSLWYATFLE